MFLLVMYRDPFTFTFYVTLKDLRKMNALSRDVPPSTCVSVSVLVRKVHTESAKLTGSISVRRDSLIG